MAAQSHHFSAGDATTRFWFDTRTVFAHVKRLVHGQAPVGSCERCHCGKLPVKNQLCLIILGWRYNDAYGLSPHLSWRCYDKTFQYQLTWEAPVNVDKHIGTFPFFVANCMCEMNMNLETSGGSSKMNTLNPDALRRQLNAYFKSFRQNICRKIIRISCC